MTRRLVLIRHGATAMNHSGHSVSTSDPDLSEDGLRHTTELAEALAGVTIDHLVTSPMLRCRRTADVIVSRQRTGIIPTVDDRLVEFGFGEFQGLAESDIEARGMTQIFQAWRQGVPPGYPPGAERFETASARTAEVFDEFTHPGSGTAVFVGHSPILFVSCSPPVS